MIIELSDIWKPAEMDVEHNQKETSGMNNIPVRTFSMTHPIAGFLEFSIPIQNPQDVEAYLHVKLEELPPAERFTLTNKLVKQAEDMWGSYALWIGDPVPARLDLRSREEIQRWLAA